MRFCKRCDEIFLKKSKYQKICEDCRKPGGRPKGVQRKIKMSEKEIDEKKFKELKDYWKEKAVAVGPVTTAKFVQEVVKDEALSRSDLMALGIIMGGSAHFAGFKD